LVRYEQFLTWQILESLLSRPTVLLGAANLYWARGTRIPWIQTVLLSLWARLFHLFHLQISGTDSGECCGRACADRSLKRPLAVD